MAFSGVTGMGLGAIGAGVIAPLGHEPAQHDPGRRASGLPNLQDRIECGSVIRAETPIGRLRHRVSQPDDMLPEPDQHVTGVTCGPSGILPSKSHGSRPYAAGWPGNSATCHQPAVSRGRSRSAVVRCCPARSARRWPSMASVTRSMAASVLSCGSQRAASPRARAASRIQNPFRSSTQFDPLITGPSQAFAVVLEKLARSLQPRGRPELCQPDIQPERISPVMPFRPIDPHKRLDRDPGDTQRVGDDRTVHGLAYQHLAAQHAVEHRIHRPAHIDQVHTRSRGGLRPGAVDQAFPVRHERDAIAFRHRSRHCRAYQRGGVPQAEPRVEAKGGSGAWSPHEIHVPVRIRISAV